MSDKINEQANSTQFASFANIQEILNDFKAKGVNIVTQDLTAGGTTPDVNKYGVWFCPYDIEGKAVIYYRDGEGTEAYPYTWQQFSVAGSGGEGDYAPYFNTGYIEERTRTGSTEVDNYLHLGHWTSEESHEYPEDWEEMEDWIPIILPAGGGGGGTGTSVITFQNKTPSAEDPQTLIETALGMDTYINFSWTSTYKEGGGSTGPGTITWYKDGTQIARQTRVAQGDVSFNIKDYLSNGTQDIMVKITDTESTTRSFTWEVDAQTVSLTWDVSTDGIVYYGQTSPVIQLRTSGSNDKTVYFRIYDSEGTQTFEKITTRASSTVSISPPAQGHGAFTIQAYMEMETMSGTITTDTLQSIGIWIDGVSTDQIVVFKDSTSTIKQFNTTSLKWMGVDPTEDTCTVTEYIGNEIWRTETVDRTVQTLHYKANEQGTLQIEIRGDRQEEGAVHILTVIDSGLLRREVTDNLIMDVNPEGHSNSEPGITTTFGYTDYLSEPSVNHPFVFSSNFDWVNGGFQTDDDGVTAFVIKRGTNITFDRSLFLAVDNTNGETSFPGYGKSIEMIFKTANTETWEADLGSSYSDNIGLQLKAHKAYFTAGNTITAAYSEAKLTELCINIKRNADVPNASAMKFWLAGTPAGANIYNGSQGGTSFAQSGTGEKFHLGSDNCDIWLYRFKMYRRSLTDEEMIDNFVADCVNSDERIERDNRNNIYEVGTSGTISKTKLMAASPSLHIINIESDKFPPTKGGSGKTACIISHQIGNGRLEDQWLTKKASKDPLYTLQGTSSMNYRQAAGNLDLDMKKCTMYYLDEAGEEVEIKKWKHFDDAVGEKYFNLKANVASSENANNMCLADLYNEYDPYMTRQKAKTAGTGVNEVRDTMRGWPCAVFLKNTGSSALQLGVEGARWVQPGEEILYFAGDLLNSKKNTDTCGEDDYDNGQYNMEFAENNNKKCIFHETSDFMDENWEFDASDWTDIKARYPHITDPSTVSIQNELVYTVTGEEESPYIRKKVKYLINVEKDPTIKTVTDRLIYTVTGSETSNIVYLQMDEKYVENVTLSAGDLVEEECDLDSGLMAITITGLLAGTQIIASYNYHDENAEITLTGATLLKMAQNGWILFDITGQSAGTQVLANYTFDRVDQFAPRYPEDEWMQGFYLVEGGITRDELLTDDDRKYFDFYTHGKERFVNMHNFIASCTPLPYDEDDVPSGYTEELLPEPVVIGGVTYDRDTLEYRKARFKSNPSENIYSYFNVNQLIFHYLFTEFFTMVDNRGKNMFCSWEEDNSGTDVQIETPETLCTIGETKQERRYVTLPRGSIYPDTITIYTKDGDEYIDVTDTALGVYTEAAIYVDETSFDTDTVLYVSYKYRDGSNWRFNFAKDYDNDTALGIDNKGKLILDYGLEDTDMLSEGYVFNAATNSLWVLVRECFSDELAKMYETLENDGLFNRANLINKFYEYQKVRPEALMIEDAKGKYDDPITNLTSEGRYASNTSFMVDMELGEKIDQRQLFITYQQKYFASKYSSPSATDNALVLQAHKGNSFNSYFELTPYSDIYAELQIDGQKAAKTKIKHDTTVGMQMMKAGAPWTGPDSEVAMQVCSFSSIKHLSTLAYIYTSQWTPASADKAQDILIGSDSASYKGWSGERTWTLSPGAATLCKEINIRGQIGLAGQLDLTSNKLLETLNAINTKINEVDFATGAPVKSVQLGSYIDTLKGKQLTKVTQFTLTDYTTIRNMLFENCEGIPYETLLQNATNLTRLRLTGVNMSFTNCAIFKPILGSEPEKSWGGYDAQGALTDKAVITGTIHFNVIGTTELEEMNTYFGSNLTITYDSLVQGYSIYRIRYYNDEQAGGAELYYEYIDKNTYVQEDPVSRHIIDAPTKAQTTQYRYTWRNWKNGDTEVTFPLLVTENIDLTANYNNILRNYDISFVWLDYEEGDDYNFRFTDEKVHTKVEGETGVITVNLKGNNVPNIPITSTEGAVVTGWTVATGVCTIDITDVSVGDDILVSYLAKPVYTVNGEYGSEVVYDLSQFPIPNNLRLNKVCTGFKKEVTSSAETASIKFTVNEDLVVSKNCKVQSVFEKIELPASPKDFRDMTWAQIKAVCDQGHVNPADQTEWITVDEDGVVTTWLQYFTHGYAEQSSYDKYFKTITLYNGDTYKIQVVGYNVDTDDLTESTLRYIPVTFGTVDLSKDTLPYHSDTSTASEAWNNCVIRAYLNGEEAESANNFRIYDPSTNSTRMWKTTNGSVTSGGDAYLYQFPIDLQQIIQEACKQNSKRGIFQEELKADPTYDKLFVPSPIELGSFDESIYVQGWTSAYPTQREIYRMLPATSYPIYLAAQQSGAATTRVKYAYGTTTGDVYNSRYSAVSGLVASVTANGTMVTQNDSQYVLYYGLDTSYRAFPIYFCIGDPV